MPTPSVASARAMERRVPVCAPPFFPSLHFSTTPSRRACKNLALCEILFGNRANLCERIAPRKRDVPQSFPTFEIPRLPPRGACRARAFHVPLREQRLRAGRRDESHVRGGDGGVSERRLAGGHRE